MKKQLLVTSDRGETRVAILESEGGRKSDARVAELYVERRGSRSIVGNIYKGKVDNVLGGLEAAFVDIGLEKNGFLHADDVVIPGVEVARRWVDEAGLRVSSLCRGGFFTDGDPARRAAALADNRAAIDEAAALLTGAGFGDVRNLPTPPGAPALTVGRRPPD